MIEITSKTRSGKINLVGLSVSTDNEENYVEVKMIGGEKEIVEMIVNTIKDGLADEGTKKTTENLINVLSNSIVGICQELDDYFLAKQLIRDLTEIVNNNETIH